jgi:hypothetical protein
MRVVLLVPLVVVAVLAACGVGDFEPVSKIDSVRILASRADKPYAKPGDAVHLEVLAVDRRPDRSRPMTIYWIPYVCEDPKNDAYYACFGPAQGDAGADAPRDGGRGGANPGQGLLRPGVDLTPFLKTGPEYDFTMPADAITAHPTTPGVDEQYGLAVLFNVACAGHLEALEIDPAAGLQQVPIGCFDENKNRLDSSQFVIGLTRVFAYATRTNANPVLEGVTFEGDPVDLAKGIKLSPCTTAKRSDCPEKKIDVQVPETSWELNPGDKDPNGVERHEQIYAAYFSDVGQLEGAARLLYDPARGKVDGSEVKYQAPNETGEGTLFIVVHDNRGGATWVTIPLHVH